jgi:MoxR-like ATPase
MSVSEIVPLREFLNGLLRGKEEVIELVLVCLLSRGHLLVEDKPGLGKTTLAKGLAMAAGAKFGRVQCTPDLLPSDITGFNVLNQKSVEFEFRPGPVFSDILLADEINRATPRTQSALLEAMAERQVTVDAIRRPLSPRFFVIATQNPGDQHGTYPLPEAQLDRFAMKLGIGYPAQADEVSILKSSIDGTHDNFHVDRPLLDLEALGRIQDEVSRLSVTESLLEYMVRVAANSRRHPRVQLGVSPRGLLSWLRAAQARAWLAGRNYVVPDDLRDTAHPVLEVRLAVDHDLPGQVIEELLEETPLPEYKA